MLGIQIIEPAAEHADTITVHVAVQNSAPIYACCMQMLHRLDWCTTGVLVLARTQAASRRFTADMTAHRIQKQYKVSACISTDSQLLQALHTDAKHKSPLGAFSGMLSALVCGN